MKKLVLFAIPLTIFLLVSCNSSKITSSWNQDKQTPVHFNKILVIGLFDDKNRELREQMENQLVQELKEDGFNTVGSLSEYGPQSFKNLSEKQVLESVRSKDIDGVITIGLIDKTKERRYVPNDYQPYGAWFYRPWGYLYRPYYIPGFYGGHYETNINYVFETNLYRLGNKQLIHSVQTQSYDAYNINSLADGYSRSVVKDLRKKNVLS